MKMWRNLINRIRRRRPAAGISAAHGWEAADRKAAQQRLLDQARRQQEHRYDDRSVR
jgi:hypothetical protein